MAKGIKSFKKGLADDSDQAGDEVKSINQQQSEDAAKQPEKVKG